MTRVRKFNATDDDLPDFFFTGKLPAPRKIDGRREVALEIETPVLLPHQQSGYRNERRSNLAEVKQQCEKRQYIKLQKKLQMAAWIDRLRLEKAEERMNEWETKFFASISAKFERYGPERVKWITMRQFLALRSITARHCKLALEGEHA